MLKAHLEIIASVASDPPEGFMCLNSPISFENDSVFGREQVDVDYAIADDYVSRKHFQIAFMGEEAYLTDLNSRHGTYLNGDRISKSVRLHSGDSIRVGKTTLTFQLEISKKTSRNRPALASFDQPAIVSIDGESSSRPYHAEELGSSLQDHPTDVDNPLMVDSSSAVSDEKTRKKNNLPSGVEPGLGRDRELKSNLDIRGVKPIVAASAVLPVDESGLEVNNPDSQPQYEFDPADHPLLPDIISTESVTEPSGNEDENEVDGPVFIDDFDVGMLPMAKSSIAPVDMPVSVSGPELAADIDDESTGEISLGSSVSSRPGAWKQLPSGWFDYDWYPSSTADSLCHVLDVIGQKVSLWGMVQFGKIGSSTPWGLADCQPVGQGFPEPIAKAYGPVVAHYSSLRKVLKSEVICKLWEGDALLMIGGDNASAMQKGLRERNWLLPAKGEVGFRDFPIYSSSFWHLWAYQSASDTAMPEPRWVPHISIVLMRGEKSPSSIRVLARQPFELPKLN